MNNFLELKKIFKTFKTEKTVKVLKNLSQKFDKGKSYSIMGPSGSGKSTLLNLISLIDRPSSGSIHFDKIPVNFNESEKNDVYRSKKIGIVYQQNNLLPDFTALENIYLASLAINDNKELAISNAEKLLKKIGLSKRADHFPSQLSGGEAQRVAIARAIVNDPKLIIADEPTGNLDPEVAEKILNILMDINNRGTSIIMTTHNYNLMEKYKKDIYLCEGGRFYKKN